MLEEKAKELGRIIGQSDEYKAVKRSTDALNGDGEAMKLLARLEELRAEAGQLMQQGQQPLVNPGAGHGSRGYFASA